MGEKLTIRNFGPIKNVELTFSRFNILTGEQATGKSTIVKTIAVCRYFSYIIDNYQVSNRSFEDGLASWGLLHYLKDNTYIYYENEDYTVEINKLTLNHNILNYDTNLLEDNEETKYESTFNPISKKAKNLLSELQNISPFPIKGLSSDAINPFDSIINTSWTIPTSFFLNDVSNVINNPIYLTAERSFQAFFSLGKSSLENISDSLFQNFAKINSISKNFQNDTYIEPFDILYKNSRGENLFRNKDHEYIKLAESATGYQSAIPIVLALKFYTELRRKTKHFIIEEPELSLYPEAQNKLIEFIVDKTMNYYDNQTFITTHSPYILSSLNNLLYAGSIYDKHRDKISSIINPKLILHRNDISAYKLEKDGTASNLISQESPLMMIEKIDSISDSIYNTFYKIAKINGNNS